MAPLPALYLRTFLIGLAVAAPVGAMGVLCIQRTLSRGRAAGLATGFGIATADGIYAGIAAFGIAAVSSALVSWQTPMRLVGGAVLVYLGVTAMLARPRAAEDKECRDVGAGLASTYASSVGLTLTNPMTIMAFGAVFASAGLVAQPGVTSAAVATAGVASGSLTWWLVLVTGTSAARAAAGDRLLGMVARLSGGVIAVFGIVAIAAAFLH